MTVPVSIVMKAHLHFLSKYGKFSFLKSYSKGTFEYDTQLGLVNKSVRMYMEIRASIVEVGRMVSISGTLDD